MISNRSLSSVVCFGEVLWDIISDGPQPGGAPLNVAYHLAKLRNEASIISRVGMYQKGEDIIKLITKWGIDKTFLQVDTYYATRQEPDKTICAGGWAKRYLCKAQDLFTFFNCF